MTKIITDIRRNGINDYILLQGMYYYLYYAKGTYRKIITSEVISFILLFLHFYSKKSFMSNKYLFFAINIIGLCINHLSSQSIFAFQIVLYVLFSFIIKTKLKKYNTIN